MELPGYEILGPAGQGGMGEVWRARHRRTGLPVAIKAVHQDASPTAALLFETEVRALASLDHPAIAAVLDHGWLDDGRGWIALEWCDGGTLEQHPPQDWEGVLAATRAVLDGLAHAHARRVLHRDVKPANVLRAGERWKLGDFGVSRLGPDRQRRVVGTAAYMAPEQAGELGLEQGPWSDLYGLGCLVWHLVTGAPPFRETSSQALQRAHRSAPLPALEPRMAVPEGLGDWLGWLLQRTPTARPRLAAHARAGLDALGPATVAPRPGRVVPVAPWDASDTFDLDGDLDVAPAEAVWAPSASRGPVPPTWRTARAAGTDLRLRDVGLALLPWREPPLIGRDEALDVLWSELVQVIEGGRSRIVVLSGPAGVGRTRLARRVARAAHEAGVGDWLTVGSDDAVVPRESHAVVIADDIEAASAAELVARVRADAQPVLWLWIPEGGEAERALAPAADRVLSVGGLSFPELCRVLRGLLPLAPEAMARLIEGAEGRPGPAVGQLHGFAAAGRLRPSAHGYLLAGERSEPVLPSEARLFELDEERRAAMLAGNDGLVLTRSRELVELVEALYDCTHVRWWWGWCLLVQDLREMSYLEEAERVLEALARQLPLAPSFGRGRWHIEQGQVCRVRGQAVASAEHADRALEAFDGDPGRRLFDLRTAADLYLFAGRPAAARAIVDRLEHEPASDYGRGWHRRLRARVLAREGHTEAACEEAVAVATLARERGWRDLERAALALAGELSTRLGDLERAQEFLSRGQDLLDGSFADDGIVNELNFAVLELRRGRSAAALALAEQLRHDPRLDHHELAAMAVEQVEGAAAAGVGDWDRFRACFERLLALARVATLSDPDFVSVSELALEQAAVAGRDDDAALAREVRDLFAARLRSS